LSDEDVDRIASRVVGKGLMTAIVIVATLLVAPVLVFPVLAAMQTFTRGMAAPIAVAITAAVIAVPVIAYILVWGRRRTR
jgi:hypothetical protein